MSCSCRCHAYGPGSNASCDPEHDKGSSGVPGFASCSPCDHNDRQTVSLRVRHVVERGDGDCQVCGSPAQGTLCSRCTKLLGTTIGEIPALLAELETTVARQDRLDASGTPVYGRGPVDVADQLHAAIPARLRSRQGRIALPSTPWAFAPDGAETLRAARAALLAWAHKINATVSGPRPTTPRTDLRSQDRALCTWLVEHRNVIAQDDLAGELFHALTWHRNEVERSIDRRDPDVFLGTCDAEDVKVESAAAQGPVCWGLQACGHDSCATVRSGAAEIIPRTGTCGADLYAHAGDKNVVCQVCGWSYSVATRKEKLLKGMLDQIRPVPDVANAVSGFLMDEREEPVSCSASMIRGFIFNHRIFSRGTAPDGRSQLVLVSDVVDLLRERLEKAKARRAKPRKVSA